ncbi:DUF805 domain-containing protein [Streptomyces tauricus]|uniref:hypothetical protein n=1 Tax=Streptomyces tauricus TaxID=68274 RepID=UPI002243A7C8|nr:hypothetical protein [Streptomyces tauricus]MCW8103518.1 DUF805 domain-containing protein [Streptomyces tauricus]
MAAPPITVVEHAHRSLIPVAGPVLYLLGMAMESAAGPNRYDPSPKVADQSVD